MNKKISSIFCKFSDWLGAKKKRKRFFVFGAFLFFVACGLIIPIHQAHAFIQALALLIANCMISIAIQLVLTLVDFFLRINIAVMSWVMAQNFIGFSYTNPVMSGPNLNPVIYIGWTVVRDLTNMTFVIILIIMGLGTALRLNEYKLQKLLPTLFGIGLLINFTPVILGVVVDASNILMNFFLEKVSSFSEVWAKFFSTQKSIVEGVLKGCIDPLGMPEHIVRAIMIVAFDFVTMFVFFMFSVLFILRRVAIWMLVILSPIMFAAYILPQTRHYFTWWWRQFTSWCFVGVTCAFFLYLGNHMVNQMLLPGFLGARPNVPGVSLSSNLVNFFSSVMPFFVALIFLIVGFFFGISTSAMGSAGIIRLAQTTARHAPAWLGREGLGAARKSERFTKAEERFRMSLENTPVLGRLVGGPGTYETQKRAKMSAATGKIEKIPDTPQGNMDLRKRIGQRGRDLYERAAIVEVLAKRKELSGIDEKYLLMAKDMGANVSAIQKARPDLAPKLGTGATVEEAVKKITPGDFWQNIQKEALVDRNVVIAAAKDDAKVIKLGLNGRQDVKKQFRDTFLTVWRDPTLPTTLRASLLEAHDHLEYDPEWQI